MKTHSSKKKEGMKKGIRRSTPKKAVSKTLSQKQGKTKWTKLKRMSEQAIVKAAKSDPDAQPLSLLELKKSKRVYPPKTINIKKIRIKLKLTQKQFAGYFAVGIRTVQEWEQGRRKPTATARNFLKVIEREPKAVRRALTSLRRTD